MNASPECVAKRILEPVFAAELIRADTVEPADRFVLTAFQQRAVERADIAMQTWGGVLLCDAVGLGKTYVGLALARRRLQAGRHVIVIVPASLRPQWLPRLRDLCEEIGVGSIGVRNAPLTLLSHSQLSRGRYSQSTASAFGTVIVDEAHAFRNPRTRRYNALARLVIERDVCLITASPVNNSLLDLHALIRLWATEDRFAAAGVAHLGDLFRDVQNCALPPPAFRRLLREIMIRRSRDDVAREATSLPRRFRFPVLAPPRPIRYDADRAAPGSHRRILECIGTLDLRMIEPTAGPLLRYLLLKRLASSTEALRATTLRLIRFHEEFVEALNEGFLLKPADLRVARSSDGSQLSLRRMTLQPVAKSMDTITAMRIAMHDLERLEHMRDALASHAGKPDDKLSNLNLLLDELAGQRVLVFTEFRETSVYLWKSIRSRRQIGLVHGSAAFLGAGRAGRLTVLERFASSERSRRKHHPREQVHTLIATDVLAEGLNLQECAHVVSYDLPWNPVRLIQRVGRIDRMGSPHATVFAYNFMPDQQLEDYLALLKRLRIKLHAIALSLGADRPVLEPDGPVMTTPTDAATSWEHLRDLAKGVLPEVGQADLTARDERLRAWVRDAALAQSVARTREPGAAAPDGALPVCTIATLHQPTGIAVVVERNDEPPEAWFCHLSGTTAAAVDPAELADLCLAGGPHPLPAQALPIDEYTLRTRVASILRQLRAGPAHSLQLTTRRPASTRLVSAITAGLASSPGGPDPADLRDAEVAIAGLSRPLPIAIESALSAIDLRWLSHRELLDKVKIILDAKGRSTTGPDGTTPRERPRRIRLLAVILLGDERLTRP